MPVTDGEPACWSMIPVAKRFKERFSNWDGISVCCKDESSGRLVTRKVPAYARALLPFAEMVLVKVPNLRLHAMQGKAEV